MYDALIKQLEELKRQLLNMAKPTNRQLLYQTAKDALGKTLVRDNEATEIDEAEVGCARAVNFLHKKTFGKEIGGGASTLKLYQALMTDLTFEEIQEAETGAIVISPTGMGNGKIVGHVGICGAQGIMSNDSRKEYRGTWRLNFSYQFWSAYYHARGGLPILYFRKLG